MRIIFFLNEDYGYKNEIENNLKYDKNAKNQIKNQNIKGQTLNIINIKLKGKIVKKNQIHKRIQNKKNQFETNSMIMDKSSFKKKNRANTIKPLKPTTWIMKLDHNIKVKPQKTLWINLKKK